MRYCEETVSNAGHAFGAMTGFLVGLFILKNRKVEKWEVKLQTAAFVIFSAFVVTLLVWHIAGTAWFEATNSIGRMSCLAEDSEEKGCPLSKLSDALMT